MSRLQTIRVRLTLLYSTVLFVVASAALGVTYLAVERSLDPKPITRSYQAQVIKQKSDGRQIPVGTMEVAAVESVESEVNLRTLENLKLYSFWAVGGLLVISLGTGWVLSGRVLRPVRSIAVAAQEIQATDLTRRINLGGPQDELRGLADTVDSMLDRLESAFAAQRQLIDDASHELRSPLAIIRANLEASLTPGTDSGVDEAERRHAVQVIDRATTRMSTLVEDLLATARRESPGDRQMEVRLDQVLTEASEDFATLSAERGIRIARSGGPATVVGDPEALRRAVNNLLSNALRLAPEGSVVTLASGRADGSAWISVTDQGPGIPVGEQERVFDRFWRSSPSTPGERRAGLGLAIVRQIVESHRGRVTLESAVGSGSTFTISLPAV